MATHDAQTSALLQARLLGWAPLTEPTGEGLGRDLVLARTAGTLDLARTTPIQSLTQALVHALTTRLGDDVFDVRFGFDGLDAMAEEHDPLLVRERIRIAVIQVLRREPRVRRILDVRLDGGGLSDPPGAGDVRELQVAVAFEATSGERVHLNLGAIGHHV